MRKSLLRPTLTLELHPKKSWAPIRFTMSPNSPEDKKDAPIFDKAIELCNWATLLTEAADPDLHPLVSWIELSANASYFDALQRLLTGNERDFLIAHGKQHPDVVSKSGERLLIFGKFQLGDTWYAWHALARLKITPDADLPDVIAEECKFSGILKIQDGGSAFQKHQEQVSVAAGIDLRMILEPDSRHSQPQSDPPKLLNENRGT